MSRRRQLGGDVDDHVLLAADDPPAAELHQHVARVHAVLRRRRARRAAGSSSTRRRSRATARAVDRSAARGISGATTSSATSISANRSTPVVQPARSSAAASTSSCALPAPAPRPRSEPSSQVAPASAAASALPTAAAQVVVGVEADLARASASRSARDARRRAGADQRAGRVDDVDDARAVGLHQLGLLGQRGGLEHVAHHQEADRAHAVLARPARCAARRCRPRCSASRRARRSAPSSLRALQPRERADAREAAAPRSARAATAPARGRDQLASSACAERPYWIEEPPSAVAVRDLDDGARRRVERRGDARDLLGGELVAHGVHAVAQRRVDERDHAHAAAAPRAQPLADPRGGRGHDVEVAGVERQEVAGALDLEQHA